MAKKKFTTDKHSMIPKHAKLSEKAKEELLKEFKVTIKELPRIYKNDPGIQSLDVKEGDVIKITRESLTANEAFFYRVVIDV